MPKRPEDLVFRTEEGKKGWETFRKDPGNAVAMFDGDRTTWDEVPYPVMPSPDPLYRWLLGRLVVQIRAVCKVTGRSIMLLRVLGLLVPGIYAIGQFGAEFHHDGEHTVWVERPDLKEVDRRLRQLLNDPRLAGASLEDVKSHFRAVHYQDDAGGETAQWLLGQLAELAEATGLAVLPGSGVVELGPPGVNKEVALHRFISELPFRPSVVLYAGDSGPDLGAFTVLDRLRDQGVPTVKVCASDDAAVVERADLLVKGPAGTITMMEKLCEITAP